jgi:hypothetical protein
MAHWSKSDELIAASRELRKRADKARGHFRLVELQLRKRRNEHQRRMQAGDDLSRFHLRGAKS